MRGKRGSRKLRLPHPELAGVLDTIKNNVVGARHNVVADVKVSYAIYRMGPSTADLGACYDEDGTIYIPEEFVQIDKSFADLIALHEHTEIQHTVRRQMPWRAMPAVQRGHGTAWPPYIGWRGTWSWATLTNGFSKKVENLTASWKWQPRTLLRPCGN